MAEEQAGYDAGAETENPYRFVRNDKGLWLVKKTGKESESWSPIVPPDKAEAIMEAMADFLAYEDFGE